MPDAARLAHFGPLPWLALGAVIGIAMFGMHGIGSILLLLFAVGFLAKRFYRWQAMANGQPIPAWANGCGGRWSRKWEQRQANSTPYAAPSGNTAFDAYRAEMLRRLEQDHLDFQSFLDRLRQAKDKAEFDQFMAERDRQGHTPPNPNPPQDRPSSPWPNA